MAVTGWKNPGTAANVTGVGDVAWANPTNAADGSDGTESQTGSMGATETSNILRLTNFGFTTSDIPTGATIDGIEVQYTRRRVQVAGNQVRDLQFQLRKTSGVVGSDLADTGTNWPNALTLATRGDATNLWGTTWTDSEIRSADTGIDIRAQRQGGTIQGGIGYVQMRVHYTPGTTTLVVGNSQHGHISSAPALVQANTLAVGNSVHSQTAGAADLVQANTLAVAGSAHSHQSSNVVLVPASSRRVYINNAASDTGRQEHDWTVWSDTEITLAAINKHALSGSTFYFKVRDEGEVESAWFGPETITDGVEAAAQPSQHGHISSEPALTQANSLAVGNAQHAHQSTTVGLLQANTLTVGGSVHGHQSGAVTLTQAASLAIENSFHTHISDSIELSQSHTLAVGASVHGHVAGGVELSISGSLVVGDSQHGHVSDAVSLTQANTLAAFGSVHGHISTSINLVIPGLLRAFKSASRVRISW